MRLGWALARASVVELLRYPSFSVPTLLFPVAFFLLFGTRFVGEEPELVLVSYAAFALMGVAFFQFGVGIAVERTSAWHVFLRTLPAPTSTRFAARVASALCFGWAAAALVAAAAVGTTGARLVPEGWLRVAATLSAGAVPLALLGIALGYWLRPRGALPAANLLFLGFAYAGSLWTRPSALPEPVAAVSPFLPTRLWAEELWSAAELAPPSPARWAGLLAWATAFAALAAWGHRRDEGERFR